MNLLIALFLITFESIHEGLADRGNKTIAAIIEFILLAVTTLAVFSVYNGFIMMHTYAKFHEILIGYIFLRYALFDILYNIAKGNDVFYIGTTKLYDKIWRKFFEITKFPEEHFFAWTKGLLGLIGLTLLLGW